MNENLGQVNCFISQYSRSPDGQYRPDVSTPVPLVWGGVYVWNAGGQFLNSGCTDESGTFSITIPNPGYNVGFYVEFKPYTDACRVKKDFNEYNLFTELIRPGDAQTSYDIGARYVTASDVQGAWRIFETIVNDYYNRGAYHFLRDDVGYTPPLANVCYPNELGGTSFFNPFDNSVNIKDERDTKALDTVQHEYSHFILAKVYGGWPWPWPWPHQMDESSSDGTAWTEGWANFLPLVIQKNHGGDQYFELAGGAYQYNLEEPTWDYTYYAKTWQNGQTVEGRVTGALYDIFDSSPDTSSPNWDTHSLGFTDIWDTFTHLLENRDNFYDFFQAWIARSHNTAAFRDCAYQNTINYDDTMLAQATDNSLSWSTGGSASWSGERHIYYNDADAAQSGAIIGNNKSTWIQTSVLGPGTIKFWWKVSSEFGYDFLSFYIDDIQKGDPISGTTGDWVQKQYPIGGGPADPHVFKWIYTKDVYFSDGWDCGWVDKVEWIPSSSLTITTSSLPNGTVGTAYSQTLQASGGTTPYTWSLDSGSLPGGLSLGSSTGTISGTPNTAGSFNFTAKVTDSSSSTATKPLSITIGGSGSWLTGWGYRKQFTVTGSSNGAQTNYQKKLTINRSTGTDTGSTVYVGTKCASDYKDIRFTKADGTTLLDYWIESSDSSTATVWVECDSIPASPGTANFYFYYGNTVASTASNGANTFITFDDFERGSNGDPVGGSWTTAGYPVISADHPYNGLRCAKLPGEGAGNVSQITTPRTFGQNYAVQYAIFYEAGVYVFYHAGNGNGTDGILCDVNGAGSMWAFPAPTYLGSYASDAWHTFEIRDINTTAKTNDILVETPVVVFKDNLAYWAGYGSFANVFGLANYNSPSGSTGDCYVDNFIIRNYTAAEPEFGTWGGEETF